MSDADAFEIAQPCPLKLTSAIESPSILTQSVSASPQSGFRPSIFRSAFSISRKFRGFRLCSRISSWYRASDAMADSKYGTAELRTAIETQGTACSEAFRAD